MSRDPEFWDAYDDDDSGSIWIVEEDGVGELSDSVMLSDADFSDSEASGTGTESDGGVAVE